MASNSLLDHATMLMVYIIILTLIIGCIVFVCWILYVFEIVSETSFIGRKFKKFADDQERRLEKRAALYRAKCCNNKPTEEPLCEDENL